MRRSKAVNWLASLTVCTALASLGAALIWNASRNWFIVGKHDYQLQFARSFAKSYLYQFTLCNVALVVAALWLASSLKRGIQVFNIVAVAMVGCQIYTSVRLLHYDSPIHELVTLSETRVLLYWFAGQTLFALICAEWLRRQLRQHKLAHTPAAARAETPTDAK